MNALGNSGQYLPTFLDRDLLFATLAVMTALFLLMGFVYPIIEAHQQIKTRAMAIIARAPVSLMQDVRSAAELQKRRKIIAESLQDITNRNEKKKRLKLDVRIAQAGLEVTPKAFISVVVVSGILIGFVYYQLADNALIAGGIAITLIFGAPNWILNYLRNRRINKFVLAFPPALETIVRGVRAGLPLNDCFTVIASESPDPIRSEFRLLIEALAIGLTLGEATERMAERIPTSETTFFSIVLAIQEKTGGNLGETLTNLSNVLRERKKLRDKVNAISSEAKVSAGIIGAMPFFVMLGVYITTPDYMTVLFTTSAGKMIIYGGLIWMLIGIIIMKQMINFDI